MGNKKTYTSLLLILFGYLAWGQDFAYNDMDETEYTDAHHLAYEGDHRSAKKILLSVLAKNSDNVQARSLLASTYSWAGQYDKARTEFNKATSKKRNDRDIWIAAIKGPSSRSMEIAMRSATKISAPNCRIGIAD